MKIKRYIAVSLFLLLLASVGNAQSKKSKYACDEPNPESLCNASNTCSASGQCSVDIKRDGMNRGDSHARLSEGEGQFPVLREGRHHRNVPIVFEGYRIHRRLRTVLAV